MSITFWIFLLYFCNPISSTSENVFTRLPRGLRPLRYIIILTPYFDEKHSENKQFTFDGFVSIRFRAFKDTKQIVFNYRHLNINKSTVYVNEMNKTKHMKIIDQTTDEENNFYTVKLEKPLRKRRKYVIGMNFVGNLTDSLTGFYKSSYKTRDNKERFMAVTHFEETYAREAFPCFDEPDYKAIFDIRINRLSNYTTLSNMPKKFTVANSTSDGRYMDVFKSTLRMSTYLVAFIVTDFKSVTNKFGNHSIWTQDKLIDNTKYSLQLAEDILKALEQFLQTKYQLPKLDHIAIPDFFAAGMENWGLITYSEEYLIYDPNKHNEEEFRFISQTIAHEISHMWFGNQVTCKWWTYMWLNEGFATYFQNYALSLVKPTWRLDEQFTITFLQESLFTDSHLEMAIDSLPPGLDETSPNVAITYKKAGAILRMLENVLTMPVFRAGLIYYLTEMKGKSVTDDDLWRNLQKAVNKHKGNKVNLGGLTVSEISKTWTKKAGFPLVYVERVNSTTVKIQQYTFAFDSNGKIDNLTASDWWIPINFATGEDPNFHDTTAMYWLGKDPIYIECDASDWIIFNKHQTGYYRVFYDSITWKNIIDLLLSNHEIIPPVNRAQLIDDSFIFLIYEYITQEDFFRLTKYLINETDLIPWFNMNKEYNIFATILDYGEKNVTIFQEHIRNMISKVYDTIDIENPNLEHTEKLKRKTIFNLACAVLYEKCLQDAHMLFNKVVNEMKTISPDLQESVFKHGLNQSSANTSLLIFFFERAMNSKTEIEKYNAEQVLNLFEREDAVHKIYSYLEDKVANNVTSEEGLQYFDNILKSLEKHLNVHEMDVPIKIFMNTFNIFEKGLKSATFKEKYQHHIKRLFKSFEGDFPELTEYLEDPEKNFYKIRDLIISLNESNMKST